MSDPNTESRLLNLSDDTIRMSERISSKLQMVSDAPASTGRTLYLKYLNGHKLNARQSVIAFCFDCMGFYHDGRHDCESYLCPHYPFMPYGKMRKRYIRPERRGNGENGNHKS